MSFVKGSGVYRYGAGCNPRTRRGFRTLFTQPALACHYWSQKSLQYDHLASNKAKRFAKQLLSDVINALASVYCV